MESLNSSNKPKTDKETLDLVDSLIGCHLPSIIDACDKVYGYNKESFIASVFTIATLIQCLHKDSGARVTELADKSLCYRVLFKEIKTSTMDNSRITSIMSFMKDNTMTVVEEKIRQSPINELLAQEEEGFDPIQFLNDFMDERKIDPSKPIPEQLSQIGKEASKELLERLLNYKKENKKS